MVYHCGVLTASGAPCQRTVQREGQNCPTHAFSEQRQRNFKHGRYDKHLRTDVAKRVRELADATVDTLEEEALTRWMLTELLEAYQAEQVSWDQVYTNLLAGVETLRRAYETREKLTLARKRVILPEEFVRLVALLGDIVQRRVSDERERQLIAADFGALLRGQRGILQYPDYAHPRIAPGETVQEIIESAIDDD